MSSASHVEKLLTAHSLAIHKRFEQILARYAKAPPRLIESIAYSLYAGGKRLRPALILESCHACGGDAAAMDNSHGRRRRHGTDPHLLASSTTICRPWTTTTSAAAGPPITRSSAKPWPSSPATP